MTKKKTMYEVEGRGALFLKLPYIIDFPNFCGAETLSLNPQKPYTNGKASLCLKIPHHALKRETTQKHVLHITYIFMWLDGLDILEKMARILSCGWLGGYLSGLSVTEGKGKYRQSDQVFL